MQPTGTTTETKPNGAPPAETQPDPVQAKLDAMQEKIDLQQREIDRQRGHIDAMNSRGEDPGDEQPEPVEADPFADESPDLLMEAIGREGMAALAKRGFVHKRDIQKIVEPMIDKIATQRVSEYAQVTSSDAKFAREFPELMDDKSPLFKQTAEIFQEMVKSDPSLKSKPEGLAAAARAAREVLKATKGTAGTGEADRRQRIAAQAGDRGGAAAAAEDSQELTDAQKRMADNLGISHEAYAKRATAGVRMSSRSGRAN